jgi:mannose-6-phosphate isomerase-like protein (cupin superfamily)
MNQAASLPRLRTHANYIRLVALAAESHARGRDPFAATPRDIALARLYCHAFRRHVIGAFHATRRELAAAADAGPAAAEIARAAESLADLADRSMDAVEHDVRALISSFHHYAVHVGRVVESLGRACDLAGGACRESLGIIRDRFVAHMEAITAGNGLSLTRDDAAPAQGCFQVPNLGITIVPLVYGDHHSWNLAWLDGEKSDVPCHLHREGVEIHLGYGPLHGHTILGDVKAEVTEGYAMPIPPGTRHGYVNIGSRTHHVPFIFGSLTRGGWGVFLDVDARPTESADLAVAPVTAADLNGTVFLEREIAAAAAAPSTCLRTVIPAARTDRDGTGGIALSIATVAGEPLVLAADRFRAVSVIHGPGTLRMAGEEVSLTPHDHFGIPAGLPATITARGGDPLVLLDATLERTAAFPGSQPASRPA